MIYGYCRVSTPAQGKDGRSLEAQSDELYRQGAEIIWSDTFTGTRTDRPQFQKLLGVLQAGDTLLVTKTDRIARSVGQVNDVITELLSRGVAVHVLNLGVLDASPTGQLIRTIMLALAQFERDMIVQRTQEGKAIARKNPVLSMKCKGSQTEADWLLQNDLQNRPVFIVSRRIRACFPAAPCFPKQKETALCSSQGIRC